MKEVALAATADKEHIQQMSNTTDEILAIVRRQQATIERQSKQISDLIEQNSRITEAIEDLKNDQPKNPTRQPRGDRGGVANPNKRPRPEPRPDKENEEPAEKPDKPKKPKCAICGWRHVTKDCYELECIIHKRPEGWTSRFA